MSGKTVERHTLTEFFHDLVQGAMQLHQIESSELSEVYLVGLLEYFAHPAPGWDERPLALDYLESFHDPTSHQYLKLKRVGDTALFLSGVFMEYLERRIVSTEYYISLGRTAYHHLAMLGGPQASGRGDVYAEMADRFDDFVRVLSEISFAQIFPSESQTVRIYTRWLRTRSRQDEQWLLRQGLLPIAPGGKTHH